MLSTSRFIDNNDSVGEVSAEETINTQARKCLVNSWSEGYCTRKNVSRHISNHGVDVGISSFVSPIITSLYLGSDVSLTDAFKHFLAYDVSGSGTLKLINDNLKLFTHTVLPV